MLGNKDLGKVQEVKLAGFKDWPWVNEKVPMHGDLQRPFYIKLPIAIHNNRRLIYI